jgi:hypothetical protein
MSDGLSYSTEGAWVLVGARRDHQTVEHHRDEDRDGRLIEAAIHRRTIA